MTHRATSGALNPAPASTLDSRAVAVLVLLGLVVIAGVIINPFGDFPLNDDWSYAAATRTFARTGDWRPGGWVSMPLITNALWATPVCRLTACTFDDLRFTTLVAGVVFTLATFWLVQTVNGRVLAAFVAAVLVCFNPIALPLSYSFMTDILFAALCTVGALLFLRAIERQSWLTLVVATLVAIAATLSRQLGLFVPLAFLFVRLLAPGSWWRRIVEAIVPVAVCAAALVLFNRWLAHTGRTPAAYSLQSETLKASLRSPMHLVVVAKSNIVILLLYLGLFTCPLTLLTRCPRVDGTNRVLAWLPTGAGALAVLLSIGAMIGGHRMMPYGMNYLNVAGVGLPTLHDAFTSMATLPKPWWGLVTLMSLIGAFGLVERFVTTIINGIPRWRGGYTTLADRRFAFVVLAVLIYVTPLLIIIPYDRYYVVVLPLVLMFLADSDARGADRQAAVRIAVAGAVCTLLSGFAILATHDYMAWNRARWALIGTLEASQGANPSTLDGGFEYNGANNYDPAYVPSPGKSDWWVQGDDFMIAFAPLAGFKVIGQEPYRIFLPPSERKLYALRRVAD